MKIKPMNPNPKLLMKQTRKIWPYMAIGLASGLGAQTSILVDFGKAGLESTAETDPNSYHWNNIVPDASATNGVLGWELLSEEEKAAYTDPGAHYAMAKIIPYTAVADAVDQAGSSTGVSIVLSAVTDIADYTNAGGFGVAGLEYSDDLGAIPTQTGYPATATIDSFYINWEFVVTFTLSGLDDSETYDLKMWGGQGRSARPSGFIVNGDTEGKQTFETLNNVGAAASDYALFEDVAPVGGVITIEYLQGVANPNAEGSVNGQWSTLEVTGNFGGEVADWYGYSVDGEGWANTGTWLGWVNVNYDPYIYLSSLNKYLYIADDSGWAFAAQ